MLICFVYHFYYKTNKKKLIDSRSMNHAEKLEFDPSHHGGKDSDIKCMHAIRS